jgi:hypothetical protein
MEVLNFLTDDWKKIPQNYRYLILSGVFLISNSWLLDHWGNTKAYTYFGFDIRESGYSMGLTLIFIALLIIVAKQINSFRKVLLYQHKYPVEKLDTDFYLVWFNGKLMLFDAKSKPKRYYHVYPWETAQNLLFVGRGFEVQTSFMPNTLIEFQVNFEGKMIKFSDFQNGGAICTQ